MTRQESVRELREVLIQRETAIQKLVKLDETQPSVGDTADQSVANDITHIAKQVQEKLHNELAQINDALERMSEGSYGNCEGCEKPIPMARLQALPYASQCINCQREFEKGQTRFSSNLWHSIPDDDPNVVDLPPIESVE